MTKWKIVYRKIHPLKLFSMAVQYVHRNERKKTVPRYFFSLIGLKLSGRNCETINCAFYQGCTVWRRFSGGPPALPATIFPSAFHSLCLSHFSINLHDLTPFIETGACLLQRTNKMGSFSLPHTYAIFSFSVSPSIPLTPFSLGCGVLSAQDAELHSALQGFSRHEAVCVRLKRGNLWRAGRAL